MNKAGKEVLDILMQGNKNFVEGITTAKNRTVDSLKAVQFKNAPIACIVTCADSRTVPEFFFDRGIGDLFVVRGAGGVIGSTMIESIEFATEQLKVPLVMILGHDDCGLMKAVLDSYPNEPENLSGLLTPVYEIMDNDYNCISALARDFVLLEKLNLLKCSNILRKAQEEGRVDIVCGFLKFDSGEVVLLD